MKRKIQNKSGGVGAAVGGGGGRLVFLLHGK